MLEAMGIDQEAIRKRFSQLEMDINNMNKMIDENLQINERSTEDAEHVKEEEQEEKEEQEVENGVMSPKKFSEITASEAQGFVSTAGAQGQEGEKTEELAEQRDEEPMEQKTVEPVEQKVSDATERKIQDSEVESFEVPEPVREATSQPRHADTTGDTTDYAVDRTTDTSEDFTVGNVTTATSSHSSLSSPVEPETPIFIPKNNATLNTVGGPGTTTLRRPTNPFRVVSVGASHSDGSGTRKPSDEARATDVDSATKLQKRLDYLTKKCLKLQKEIKYLHDMNYNNTLSIEDGRKLSSAIDKLQEYLDRKTKEKYDLGVLVSRQLRKEIDRGENGQFWIGTK